VISRSPRRISYCLPRKFLAARLRPLLAYRIGSLLAAIHDNMTNNFQVASGD
jgi:hypothetical protein